MSQYSELFSSNMESSQPNKAIPSSRLQQVMTSMQRFATLSEMLRILGAAIMVGGMSLFLMQGWHEGNDLSRYFTLLAHTLLLTAGGFCLSHFLKEYKGARLFFGLSLISVTANFAILGALIYSVIQLDGMLGQYPGFATWIVNDPSSVSMTIIGAAIVLIPVTLLAYSIMARRSARWLTATYLLANACLLIPVRSSIWASVLGVTIVIAALYMIKQKGEEDERLSTFEGRFSKITLFIPAGILFARSWYLYHMDALAITALSTAAFVLLRHLALKLNSDSGLRGLIDVASMPLVVTTASSFAAGVEHWLPSDLLIPVFALAAVPMTLDLVHRSEGHRRSHVFGLMGALLLCSAFALNELVSDGFAIGLVNFAGCLAVLVYAYWIKQRWAVYVAAFATACLALKHLADFVLWFDFYNWITLSVIGALAIILASVLDRHGASIKLKIERFRQRKALGQQ